MIYFTTTDGGWPLRLQWHSQEHCHEQVELLLRPDCTLWFQPRLRETNDGLRAAHLAAKIILTLH